MAEAGAPRAASKVVVQKIKSSTAAADKVAKEPKSWKQYEDKVGKDNTDIEVGKAKTKTKAGKAKAKPKAGKTESKDQAAVERLKKRPRDKKQVTRDPSPRSLRPQLLLVAAPRLPTKKVGTTTHRGAPTDPPRRPKQKPQRGRNHQSPPPMTRSSLLGSEPTVIPAARSRQKAMRCRTPKLILP